MAEILSNVLPLFAFGALLITSIVEIVLSARWNKQYFSAGVSIFAFHIQVDEHHANTPSCRLLEDNFRSSGFLLRNTSLLFKELDINTIGFRESLLQFGRWYSIMHGLLIFDDVNNQVVVKGFLNWVELCLSIIWIIIVPFLWLLNADSLLLNTEDRSTALLYFGLIFVILGIFCSIDYFRFSRVAKFAAQAWSR